MNNGWETYDVWEERPSRVIYQQLGLSLYALGIVDNYPYSNHSELANSHDALLSRISEHANYLVKRDRKE